MRAILLRAYGGADALQVGEAERSWKLLTPTGTIVSAASPDIGSRTPAGKHGLWFMMKPDGQLLETLAAEVAKGELKSRVSEVVGFADIPAAIERNRSTSHTGKAMADLSR